MLGNRAATLAYAAGPEICHQRAADPPRIDSEMFIESFVFDGHDGLQQMRRQFRDRQPVATVDAAAGEDFVALGLDQHGRTVDLPHKSVGEWQGVGEIAQCREHRHQTAEHHDNHVPPAEKTAAVTAREDSANCGKHNVCPA